MLAWMKSKVSRKKKNPSWPGGLSFRPFAFERRRRASRSSRAFLLIPLRRLSTPRRLSTTRITTTTTAIFLRFIRCLRTIPHVHIHPLWGNGNVHFTRKSLELDSSWTHSSMVVSQIPPATSSPTFIPITTEAFLDPPSRTVSSTARRRPLTCFNCNSVFPYRALFHFV